jgi:hypothetical protein
VEQAGGAGAGTLRDWFCWRVGGDDCRRALGRNFIKEKERVLYMVYKQAYKKHRALVENRPNVQGEFEF